jgi:hypothetical protein
MTAHEELKATVEAFWAKYPRPRPLTSKSSYFSSENHWTIAADRVTCDVINAASRLAEEEEQ